ncbi:MAG: sulfatase [Actinobacteria bacterium]|nr:sulfatase [Actinomycetota bacterium]
MLAFATPLAIAIGVVVVLGNRGSSSGAANPVGPDRSGGPRSNVLVIMTDDQTLESMKVMANTTRLLGESGTTFSKYFVSFPNCCPSRASFLTGQYAHNNGVRDNVAPEGGFAKLNSAETLPVWLQRSGYYTASIGKYLNMWGQDGNIQPPPGWSRWFGLIDPTTYHYYNYSVSDNGKRVDYGDAEQDYQTDVLGAEAQRTIVEAGQSGQPWFIEWTPLAPHAQYPERASTDEPATIGDSTLPEPAPRYKGKMANEPLPKPASFNPQDVSGLPQLIQLIPPITPETEALLTRIYRSELETLLAVDEWVGTLFKTLQDTGQLENTTIIFTSDNGVFHGEQRLPFGKVFLYEPATHMPLIIRGGGFPAARKVDAMAVNVDLAPTILALAGAKAGLTVDGRDLKPVALEPSTASGRGVLLESWLNRGRGERIRMYAIRDERYMFMRWGSGYSALYDMASDPDQTKNLSDDPTMQTVKAQLSDRLEALQSCRGSECEAGGPR